MASSRTYFLRAGNYLPGDRDAYGVGGFGRSGQYRFRFNMG